MGDREEREEKENKTGLFERSLTTAMALAGSAIVTPGLILAAAIGGKKALLGAFVGFGIAGLHAFVVFRFLKWALRKPPRMLSSLLMASYLGRLVALGAIFYGLHFIKALDMLTMLCCFLALYIAQTVVEIAYAYKAFGTLLKQRKDDGG